MSEDTVISHNERTIRLRELLQVEYRFRWELEEIERKTRALPADMDPLERGKQIARFWNDALNFYGNLWIQAEDQAHAQQEAPAPESSGQQKQPRQRKKRRVSTDTMKTTEDAARHLGIGTRTLIKLRDKGLIPCVDLTANAVGYNVADLDAYLQKQRRLHDQKQGRGNHRSA